MTGGERLYLILVITTFVVFSFGIGRASLQQTLLDRAARQGRVAPQPAE